MKSLKYILALFLVSISVGSFAQKNKTDTLITFKVNGACEMCRERIEHAVDLNGVKSANWDIDTKMFSIVYNPSIIKLSKIHKLIAEAGHDTEFEKAKDEVYNELPACCHYRKGTDLINEVVKIHSVPGSGDTISLEKSEKQTIKGVVLEEDKKGVFKPLAGASVIWLGITKGTITDTTGVFAIDHDGSVNRLVISYTGYTSDTMTITNMKELKIILASGKELSEVKVFAKQRSTYVAALNPIRTQIMTERELFKAACCNLSESFETNPSVDVSYNDAVTGSKQIQLLGLSGNYTQLTVENLPGPRGIATPLGLNSIAGPWVESIQLNKGVGSVANGFESIAGQY
jgi:outer membrane receptor for ferrienterochelin and colicins